MSDERVQTVRGCALLMLLCLLASGCNDFTAPSVVVPVVEPTGPPGGGEWSTGDDHLPKEKL